LERPEARLTVCCPGEGEPAVGGGEPVRVVADLGEIPDGEDRAQGRPGRANRYPQPTGLDMRRGSRTHDSGAR
jgi:hypothetical protein